MSENLSNRGVEWRKFANGVSDHIENYTVPQYGDAPDDQASEFTTEDIKKHIERYANRIGANVRGMEEARRDCLKIAHYACLLSKKLNL